MPWEAREVRTGTTVYVDDEPYTVAGTRMIIGYTVLYAKVGERRVVSNSLCPPYIGLTGHEEGPQEGPRLPLLIEHDEGSLHGSPIWWVSHCRVTWDGPPVQGRHPSQVLIWSKRDEMRGTGG